MILPLQNSLRLQGFYSQANSVFTINNVLLHPASNIDGFITRDTVLLPFSTMELFCTNGVFQKVTTLRHRKINFQRITDFSQGINMHDPSVSDIMIFLQEIQSFSYLHEWGYFEES
jgi:hypothetical protein